MNREMEMLKLVYLRCRTRLESWLASREWRDPGDMMDCDATGNEIENAILKGLPFATGKVGANEQVLLRWATGSPVRAGIYRRHIHYRNTRFCLTNAGLRPRTEESYRGFATLLADSVAAIDLIGVWKDLGEAELYRQCGFSGKSNHIYDLAPWFATLPWSRALAGKRVFVVSPFLHLFQQQLSQRTRIWPRSAEILPQISLSGFEYPYMTDPKCTLDWTDVWNSVLTKMDCQSFDVVLTGCGALGLPLAAEAKRRGKVGIHLGGMLQVLFGVRGKRFDDTPAYVGLTNEFWVYPPEQMRPEGYQTIEGGCYW